MVTIKKNIMKNLELLEVSELTQNEMISIDGGRSLWYDVCYCLGAFWRAGVEMGRGAQGNPHI